MAAVIKHVRMRGDDYEYHRRVPQDVVRDEEALRQHFGSRLFRRLLGTRDPSKVLLAAEEKRREFEERLAAARAHRRTPTNSGQSAPRIVLTNEMLADIRKQQRLVVLRPWIDAYLLAEQGTEHAEELARMRYERELRAEETKELLTTSGMRGADPKFDSPLQVAERLIDELNLDAPVGSTDRSLVAVAVRQARIAGERDIDRILAGELPAAAPAPPKATRTTGQSGATLRNAVDLYLSDRSVRPKTANDVRTTLKLFEDAVGNKRLADLSRDDFAQFIQQLAKKQVGGRSRDSVARMISPGTVQKRLRFLHSAIGHAIQKGMHGGGNPASNFDISAWVKPQDKSVMPDRRPFAVAELNLVFQHPWFLGCASPTQTHVAGSHKLRGVHYWAPVMALYTGCRASELGGLKLNEVHLDGEFPHINVRDNEYRPTKEGYARLVPALDALIALGLRDYVDRIRATGADRLFPDWLPPERSGVFDKDDARWANAGPIRSFNRTVIRHTLGAKMIPGARNDVTFHSFRGTFKSLLSFSRPSIPANVINEVVGHAKSGMDKHYIKTVPLEETYPWVRGCDYTGLIIPPAPSRS